jgi:hypothetical protein
MSSTRRQIGPLTAPGGDPVTLDGPAVGLVAVDLSLSTTSLTVSGGVAFTGTISAGSLGVAGTLALTGAAVVTADSAALSAGTVLAEGVGATLSVAGTFTLAGEAAALDGGTILAGALALAGGTLDLDAGSAIGVGGGSDAGTIVVAAGGALSGYGRLNAPLADGGVVTASGGGLALFGNADGTGTLAIAPSGTLFATGAVAASLTVAFSGSGGTLDLFSLTQGFAAPVTGFAPGDGIDIASAAIASAQWSAGVLTLTDTSGDTLALRLPGAFATAAFVALPDGLGGSEVSLPSATVSGLVASDVTLGDGGGLVLLGGTSSIGTLTVDGQVALDGVAAVATLALAGTLALLAGQALSVSNITGNGLLVIEAGQSLALAAEAGLAGTLTLLGGAVAAFGTLSLAGGALAVDAASSVTVGGGGISAGAIAVAAGATLSGFGRVAAPLVIAGQVRAQGGQLSLAGAVSGSGVLAIAAGATLAAFPPAAISVPVLFATGATLDLDGGGFAGTLRDFGAGDVVDIAGARFDTVTWSPGTLSLLSGGLTLETVAIAGTYTGQAWQALSDGDGGTLIELAAGSPTPLDLTGTLDLTDLLAVPSATIEAGGWLALAGGTLAAVTISVASNGTLSGQGNIDGPVANAGTLGAFGGALTVTGAITGAGTVLIGGDATLYAPQGVGAASSVLFTGNGGTLELFLSASATGTVITGLGANPANPLGNALDIASASVSSAVFTELGGGFGALALGGASGSLGTLALAGIVGDPGVLVQPDGVGGSLIQLVPCFVAGTMIATLHGPMPVEALRAGDMVLTRTGARRLRWVGRRLCDSATAAELRPVRVAAGALGASLPNRDLLLSPQHALLLGAVLVPAVALINGGSVQRAPPGVVTYHHLGLDRHDVVLAEGLAAETWLPDSDAPRFDWEDGQRPAQGPPCAPLVAGGAPLEALRRHLFALPAAQPALGRLRGHIERIERTGGRTRLVGWALDEAAPEQPVALLAMLDGTARGCAVANVWRPDLDRAGLAGGRCGFALDLLIADGSVGLQRRADGAWLPVQPG